MREVCINLDDSIKANILEQIESQYKDIESYYYHLYVKMWKTLSNFVDVSKCLRNNAYVCVHSFSFPQPQKNLNIYSKNVRGRGYFRLLVLSLSILRDKVTTVDLSTCGKNTHLFVEGLYFDIWRKKKNISHGPVWNLDIWWFLW